MARLRIPKAQSPQQLGQPRLSATASMSLKILQGGTMPRIALLAYLLCLMMLSAFAQDPTKVDPKHYKVETENAQVRVLRIQYGPHEKSVMHGHPAAVAIFLTDQNTRFTYPDGKTED